MCVSGYPSPPPYPKFFTPYPKLFSPNSEVGREKQNKLILFCYSLPTSEFGEKNMYQNDHLKWKSELIMHSVFGIGSKNHLNKVISSKNRPFYIRCVLFNTFTHEKKFSKI